ncbi:hypothetical protein PUN4_1000078 [Paraburkholderia unamae]|nr:hypothetical protein PUN4_1000078 [Paraburkholderia unamae]
MRTCLAGRSARSTARRLAEPNKRRATPQCDRQGTFPKLIISSNGLAARRADRCVMLLTNTSSIRFVAILALGPSGGQRKPVISVNRPSPGEVVPIEVVPIIGSG